jgi:predicted DNA-binding protein with PD1-like motif
LEETKLEPVSWYRLTLGHDENLKEELIAWASEHDITLAWVQCLGELKNASTASGYEDRSPDEAEKFIQDLEDNRHVMGLGTIIRDEDGERVHLHGPMGLKNETATGCWAGEPRTYRGMDLLVAVLEEG